MRPLDTRGTTNESTAPAEGASVHPPSAGRHRGGGSARVLTLPPNRSRIDAASEVVMSRVRALFHVAAVVIPLTLTGSVHADPRFSAAFLSYDAGPLPFSVAIGDLNLDGRPDLAVANIGYSAENIGTVSVLLGNGDGTFGTTTSYVAGINPSSVAIGDVNGDGRPDLSVSNFSPTVLVLHGNGDGTFDGTVDSDNGCFGAPTELMGPDGR